MKKTLSICTLALLLFAGCTKKNNNNDNTSTSSSPAFFISGIKSSVTFTNFAANNFVSMPIAIGYDGAARELVTLTVTGLPAGITIDNTWITSGYPTFNTTLTMYDTSAIGVAAGNYTVTLTATGATSGAKSYTFTLYITNPPPCSQYVTGTYTNCYSCTSGSYYTDIVSADAVTVNKIWFSNFNNSGNHVYGLLNCNYSSINIPAQTVGGITYSGTGTFSSHNIDIDPFTINSNTSCYLDMN